MGKNDKKFLLLCAILILIFPWAVPNNYFLMVLNVAALNFMVVIGLNLLMGYAGQISLGQGAFFGLGAYLTAIFTVTLGFPLWPAMLLNLFLTALVAYLIGGPTLKLEGHYLVMATLGFNVITYILSIQLEPLTGGPSGFAGIPHLQIGRLAFDSDLKMYFLLWAVSLIVFILSLNLVHSRVGRAMAALSQNEIVAKCAGIPAENYKIKVFVFSAFLAALAGAFYAHYFTFISPGTFSFFYSIQVVTMVLVGGIGSLWGSLIGAILLTVLPEWLQAVKEYNVLIYGLILMLVLVFFPRGLLPALVAALGKKKA
ncbi:MAG: branched-chain amino acid ABC transporter permease [Thermodesulfobacteriota bacterium]